MEDLDHRKSKKVAKIKGHYQFFFATMRKATGHYQTLLLPSRWISFASCKMEDE
jgi:hypothetical protein